MSNPNTTTATENPLIVAFRQQLLKRSDAGIKSIGLYFRQIDDDGSKMVNFEEFQRGILNHNILMDKNDMVNLFNLFDRNSDGSISFDEFLATVRVRDQQQTIFNILNFTNSKPPLNNFRLNIIYKAFQKLDKTNDHKVPGLIIFNDPKYLTTLNNSRLQWKI